MADRKTYGQFCGLARGLDHIGDRWSLLIVRELLLAPARYGELHGSLPGLATNLLAQRLRQLEADGIIERAAQIEGPQRVYQLTPRGRALEPVLHAMIRWAAPYMACGPSGDVVDERWTWLALRALLTTRESEAAHGVVGIRCGERELTVVIDDRGSDVTVGSDPRATAVVTATLPALLAAVAYDDWGSGVRIEGDAAFARQALAAPS